MTCQPCTAVRGRKAASHFTPASLATRTRGGTGERREEGSGRKEYGTRSIRNGPWLWTLISFITLLWIMWQVGSYLLCTASLRIMSAIV
jgi:hypothetical protein